jgi:hypothetical protein
VKEELKGSNLFRQAKHHPGDKDGVPVQETSRLDRIISKHFGDRGVPMLNIELIDRKLSERYKALAKAQAETESQVPWEEDEDLNTQEFEIACRLIHDCRHVEIARSDVKLSRAPSPDVGGRRYILDRLQIISHLLQHRRYRSEVTAISCLFEPASSPPRLRVVFAKNKTLTPDDLKRAESIVDLVKQNADWPIFRDSVMDYLVMHSAAKFGCIFRRAILSYRDLTIYIENTVRSESREIPDSWLSDCFGAEMQFQT